MKWADYYWGTAAKYSNVAMVLWDNNVYNNDASGSNGECHMYIDRNSLTWRDPEIISAIMKHVDGTPATINGKEIPGSSQNPEPEPQPEPTPAADGLDVSYTINNWGSGYQVLIKVKNDSKETVDNWTVKVSKNEVKIDSSWCVNVEEQGNYYVITPMSWNSTVMPGASVDFGIQGAGTIGTSIDVTVE